MTPNLSDLITVKQLKEILNQFSDDLPVLTHGYERHFDGIRYPEEMPVMYNYENEDTCGMFELCEEGETESIDALVLFRSGRLFK